MIKNTDKKMQRSFLIFSLLLIALKNGNAQNDGRNLYSKRYERIDIDTVLASPRLVTNYVECLLNRKPCPPEGKDLKRILPEALRTKCGRCWPSQKEGALKVITKLYFDYPDHYNALRAKWDTTDEYHRRFEEYLRDQKFNVIGNEDINKGDQSQIRFTVTQSTNFRPVTSTTPTKVPTITTTFDPNFTQRPIRDEPIPVVVRDEQPIIISNRFGDDPNEYVDPVPTTTRSPSSFAKSPRPNRVASITTVRIAYDPTYITENINTFQTQNPILNLINRITSKFTNTAEFVAGMIRTKVKRSSNLPF